MWIQRTLVTLVTLDASDITRFRALLATVTPLIAVTALHATLIGAVGLSVALLSVKGQSSFKRLDDE